MSTQLMFPRHTAAARVCDTIPQSRPHAWVSTGVLHCEVWTPGMTTESWDLSHTAHLVSGDDSNRSFIPQPMD